MIFKQIFFGILTDGSGNNENENVTPLSRKLLNLSLTTWCSVVSFVRQTIYLVVTWALGDLGVSSEDLVGAL